MAISHGKPDPTAGANKTPAPKRQLSTNDLDKGWPARSDDIGYGKNNYPGPSSLTPGQAASAPLKAHVDSGVLQDVINRGTAGGADNWQTRDIGSHPLPNAHGMRSRTGEKVPSRDDFSGTENLVRTPSGGGGPLKL